MRYNVTCLKAANYILKLLTTCLLFHFATYIRVINKKSLCTFRFMRCVRRGQKQAQKW